MILLTKLLQFQPNKRSTEWDKLISAQNLSKSSTEWYTFFLGEYKALQDLIAALPYNAPLKLTTYVRYYFSFNKQPVNGTWLNAARANDLLSSSREWKAFFSLRYTSPIHLIHNLPSSGKEKKVTYTSYYLAQHPELRNYRLWKDGAASYDLAEQDHRWNKLVASEFNSPSDLMNAIDEYVDTLSSTKSPVSYFRMYMGLHFEIENSGDWINYAAAVAFARNNPDAFNSIFNKELSISEAIALYDLTQAESTIDKYIRKIKQYNL